jgi:hypothetical protein
MFTQYMFNGLMINPSYSSMDEAVNITALVRQQTVGIKCATNTQAEYLYSLENKEENLLALFLFYAYSQSFLLEYFTINFYFSK